MKHLLLILILLITAGWTVLDDTGTPLADPFESQEQAREYALDWAARTGKTATITAPDLTVPPPFKFGVHGSGATFTWHGGILTVTGADIVQVSGADTIDATPIGEAADSMYTPTSEGDRIVLDVPTWPAVGVTVWSAAGEPAQPERELVTWE